MSLKTDRNYQLFLSATTTSAIGSYAFNFAFMSYLYFATENDKRFVALSQLFFVVGMLLGNLSGGPLGDKLDKKRLLLFCEFIRIPLVSIMLFFSESIWPLLFLHGVKTYFAGISTPLKRSYITATVAPENISHANMGFTISYSLTQIIGPLLGTWIYFQVKTLNHIIILDLVTFFIATFLIFWLKSTPKQKAKPSDFLKDIMQGFVYVLKTPAHYGLFQKHLLVGLISGLLIPLILPFAVENLNGTEKTYGTLMALFGVGGVLGATQAKKLNQKLGLGSTIYYLCLIEPFIFLSWLCTTKLWLNFSIFFVWGALFFLRATSQFNYISKNIESLFLARTNSLFDFVFTLTNISAVTFITLSGQKFETQNFLIIVAIAYLVVNILLHFTKPQKQLRLDYE